MSTPPDREPVPALGPAPVSAPESGPVSGYGHAAYAASLAEFGSPVPLPACGGWVLERPIAGSGASSLGRDAAGCYPLFACRNWAALPDDLAAVGDRWVSLALVADPFGAHETVLRRAFPDRLLPFKEHFVVNLAAGLEDISSHHRREVRRAERRVRVAVWADPPSFLPQWVELYGGLVERHGIGGLRAFSHRAFAGALAVPGIVVLVASAGEQVVGAHLWYVQGGVAYSHLAAGSAVGYALGAAYALHAFALDYFRSRVQWIDLGGAAGLRRRGGGGSDGLARFKAGWATGTRMTWFCGRIFDQPRYAALAHVRGAANSSYFPAYREGEFL